MSSREGTMGMKFLILKTAGAGDVPKLHFTYGHRQPMAGSFEPLVFIDIYFILWTG